MGDLTSSRETRSEQVFVRLRQEILSETFVPGDALPSERKLSEDLATNRHAIREALKRLQQAGLVTISQGGATKVRDWRRHGGLELLLDLDEAPEELHAPRAAMEMRACVGADAARRCAERADGAGKAEIRARAEQLAAVDDLEARNAHYEVLWDLIVDGADNIAYRLALTTLVQRQRIASVKANAVADELRDVARVGALVNAIVSGDGGAARAAATDILERSIPDG